jgi:hypothetical protein
MSLPVALLPATDEPIREQAAVQNWPLLSPAGLHAARLAGKIAWIRGKRGSIWYRPSAIRAYIAEHLETPCRAHAPARSSNSPANGSPPSPAPATSTASGMTPELEEHVARACAQRILKPQSVAWPRS